MRPSDEKDRDTRITRWIARRQSGEATGEEVRAFDDWLAEDPGNLSAFRDYQSVMNAIDSAGPDILAEEFERELEAAYLEAAYDDSPSRRSPPQRWALAAGFAVVMIASAALMSVFMTRAPTQQYATAIGEQRTVVLDDGSSVRLNTNSLIEVAYKHGRRNVELKHGEAYFEVRRNPQRPFAVHTSLGEVVVTGTTFNVRSLGAEMEVSVLSGGVNVTAARGQETYSVAAGYRMRVEENGASHLDRHGEDDAPAWIVGKARYANEPLGEVISDLNRYFRRKISLSDETLAQLPVTGEFDVTDQASAVEALGVAFNLRAHTTPQGTVLEPAVSSAE